MWVVISAGCGSLLDAWTAHGPFLDEQDAEEWADTRRGDTGEPAYAEEVSLWEDNRWVKNSFVLIRGSLDEGLKLYGPFKSKQDVDALQLSPVAVQGILKVEDVDS